jgi:gentisate 1,2-dioxygenase
MNSPSTYAKVERSAEWKDFYDRLEQKNTAPLWEVLGQLVTPKPRGMCVPALWRYDELRPLVMEGGRMITAAQAERRVIVLENPALRGASQITSSLYAGLQLILPGEIAPSHRHVASATRFVIEGRGAYTSVDGERTSMEPGDFILTPAWSYHDHGNPGDSPVVWMDGLDIPLVNFFDAGFAEHHPQETQPVTKTEGDALARYGSNLLPVEYKASGLTAPVFTYPYSRTRETLDRLYRNGPLDPRHGIKLQYTNPATGSYPMPTMAAFIQLLPPRFSSGAYRSTDATIYCAVEGHGRTRIGDETFEWGPHDIFVAPSWTAVTHEARDESVLFSFSDRAAQKALGIWREEEL